MRVDNRSYQSSLPGESVAAGAAEQALTGRSRGGRCGRCGHSLRLRNGLGFTFPREAAAVASAEKEAESFRSRRSGRSRGFLSPRNGSGSGGDGSNERNADDREFHCE